MECLKRQLLLQRELAECSWWEEKFNSLYIVCLVSAYFVPGTRGGENQRGRRSSSCSAKNLGYHEVERKDKGEAIWKSLTKNIIWNGLTPAQKEMIRKKG